MQKLTERVAWAIKIIATDCALDKGITDVALAKILGTNKDTLAGYRKVDSDEAKQASELLKRATRATEKAKAKTAQELIKIAPTAPVGGTLSCVEIPTKKS